MIVKSIIQEDLITLSEVKEILEEVKVRRSGEVEELGYELRRAIRHADLFVKVTPADSRALVDKLLELDKISPEIAVKIADIKPITRDELRAVYAKERYTLVEEDLDRILDIIYRS